MEGPEEEDHEAEPPDEAAAAFEALRQEVYELRRFAVVAVQQRPDYTPTLGAFAASLAKIEAHPALQLTPQAHAQQLRAVQEAAQRQGEQAFVAATGRVSNTAGELARRVDQARTADRQNWRLLQVGGGGLVLGAALSVALSGPIARTMPEKMAAAIMHEDRATAGQHMISSVNPKELAETLAAIPLFRANREALAVCKGRTSIGAMARCTIRLAPEVNVH